MTRCWKFFAFCIVLLGTSAPVGGETSLGDLRSRLEHLETRIEHVEQSSGNDRWLTHTRAADLHHLVTDVLRDADTRISLQSSAIAAGHDGEFFVASTDNAFRLGLSGQIQSRFVFTNQPDAPAGDNSRYGFDLRRIRLKFKGHLIDPRLKFEFGLNAGAKTAPGVSRSDVFVSWDFDSATTITVGRFLPDLLREEMISSKRQLLTDRSLVLAAFDVGRVLGIKLKHQCDDLTLSVNLFDIDEGIDGDRTTAVLGRADWQVNGSRRQHRDLTSFPGDEPALTFGGGVTWVHRDADGETDDDLLRWTVDASFEFGGASLFASVVGTNFQDGQSSSPRDQYGVVVQGGVFLCDATEFVARYEWGDADDGSEDLSVVTIGLNYYFNGHQLKYTIDAGYAFNAIGPFWANRTRGWRTDRPGGDGQIVVRSQMQLLF